MPWSSSSEAHQRRTPYRGRQRRVDRAPPSANEENEFIRVHGFAEYAKWHLGLDDRFPENAKRRYKFPYGDFKDVHRCGLLAVKARARQYAI